MIKLFSKFKIGKNSNTSGTKQNYLCGHSRNLSDGEEDEEDDFYTGCLNKSTPNKASSRTGSTQTLDKISTKQNGNMKPAMSMIDLTSKKHNNSTKRKPIFRKDSSKTDYDEIPKEEKKDLKKRHKEDRLKRGYSWRQAYKTGAIPIEKVASKENFAKDLQNKDRNNLPKRGSKSDIYNSSYSSSSEANRSRISGDARDPMGIGVVNRYSSTLQIFKNPEPTNNHRPSKIINVSKDKFHNNNNTNGVNKSYDRLDGPRISRQPLNTVKSLDFDASMSTQVPPASQLSSSSSSTDTLSSETKKSTEQIFPNTNDDGYGSSTLKKNKTPDKRGSELLKNVLSPQTDPTDANEYRTSKTVQNKNTTPKKPGLESLLHQAKSTPLINNHPSPNRLASAENISKKNKNKKEEERLRAVSVYKPFKGGDATIYDSKTKTSYFKGNLLGKGGFARCYEMIDVKTKKKYAGKIISKNILNKGNQKEKILKEIELHKSLDHKQVVGFHSCFEDPSNVIIVLEYCSMKSLVHMLKRRKFLTEPEVRYFMSQLVTGVQYIHSQKVIHRDLKLGNMLLNASMHLKIADFGLASRVHYVGEKKMDVCGTPNYIAPEVLQKKGHSYEADIWALGCIMYALLCGRPPFETATLKETYLRITMRKYNSPPHVSLSARGLIKSLLNLEPMNRPPLEKIPKHTFFYDGFFPQELSPSTCEIQPKFPLVAIDKNTFNIPHSDTQALAQTKNTRKSASQVITRVKATEYESHDLNSNLKDLNDPNTPLTSESPTKRPTTSQLYATLKPHITSLVSTINDPLPEGAITSTNQAHTRDNRYVCVTKWIDYSDKYGFSYQLSDGSVGVLFNDHTRMLLAHGHTAVIVEDTNGEKVTFKHTNVPPQYTKKTNLLMFFAKFMEANLISGGSSHRSHPHREVFLSRWFRSSDAIVMCLTDATVQVNFIEDHTKIVFSLSDEVWVTLVDKHRRPASYPLKSLVAMGCEASVVKRLQYAMDMVSRVVEENTRDKRESKEIGI